MKQNIPTILTILVTLLASSCQTGQSVALPVTPSIPATHVSPTPTGVRTSISTLTPTLTSVPNTNTPAPPGTVTGVVMNSVGLPLATVGIKLLKNNDLVAETKTDSEGKFTLENVPPGTYKIGYDYFPEGGFAIHYFGDEFVVESESIIQQEFVINI